jgi:hypothetical protein
MSTISVTSPGYPGTDGKSLGIVGFGLGVVTAAVVMVAAVLVQAHVDGRLVLDDTSRLAVASARLGR